MLWPGYVALALANLLAASLLDPEAPRGICYYLVLAMALCGALVSALVLKESRGHGLRGQPLASNAGAADVGGGLPPPDAQPAYNAARQAEVQAEAPEQHLLDIQLRFPGDGNDVSLSPPLVAFLYT